LVGTEVEHALDRFVPVDLVRRARTNRAVGRHRV
jgi:hypothetical protein